ncbi:DUF6923 family protein [Amycolatopsis thermalba]|uniref:DUF6923 family protein n=1 Tax=Amycolatopsis thermalba TaxID=944492 RepID=UPI001FCA4529|nr:hypothetical protein [Amycolatopsis thermalba]
MRVRRTGRVLAAAAVLAVSLPGTPAAAAPAPACTVLRVVSTSPAGPSTVELVRLPSGAVESRIPLGVEVNALGYARSQDKVYGLTRDGAAVTVGRDGELTRLGPVRTTDRRGLDRATAGAVFGNRWYVQRGDDLYVIDIDPGSDGYLSAVRGADLWPAPFTSGIDDFDFAGGRLYGVTSTWPFSERVVRIDPVSGFTHPVPGPVLPPATAYGSVVGAGDTLYVTANRSGGRSRTFRVEMHRAGFERVAASIRETGAFAEPEHWRFDRERTCTRDEWLDLLPTTGGLTRLPAAAQAEILTAVGAAIDELGGAFTKTFTTLAVAAVRT